MTYRFYPVITESYSEIEEVYRNIQTKYPDKQPETIKIRLIIDLKDYVKRLSAKRLNELFLHLWKSARYISWYSGQGYFNVFEPNENTKPVEDKYEMALEIIEKDSFLSQYFAFLSPSGVKLDEIKLEEE